MKRLIRQGSIAFALSTLALTACEKGDSAAENVDAATLAAATAATAAEAAEQQRRANCPSTEGMENLLGVKIGMSEPEAIIALVCANEEYLFSREEREQEFYSIGNTSNNRQIINIITLVAETGLDRVTVSIAGLKGAERVWGLDRRIEYTGTTSPTSEALRKELTDKYGSLDFPTRWLSAKETGENKRGVGPDKNAPRIVRSFNNQRLDAGSSDYRRCTDDAGRDPSELVGNFHNARKCGFVMTATLTPAESNPNMVQSLELAIRNSRDVAKLLDEDAAQLATTLQQNQAVAAAENAHQTAANQNMP